MAESEMTPTVCILMSTYNGEKYLEEQIKSILQQEGVHTFILARDDGSKDQTKALLECYSNIGKVSYYSGENLGPARSFMRLLNDAPDCEYYAFSDQDDFWKPEKLRTAVEVLKSYSGIPALYFSQTQLTDEHLNPTETKKIHPLLTFGESLVYEFAPGCTMVMNKKLRDIVCSYTPNYLKMHDVWVYSIALSIGAKVIFDPVPHILYRQHGRNAVGQGYGITEAWRRRLKRIVNNEQSRYQRGIELRNGFLSFMDKENADLLRLFIQGKNNLSKRLRILSDKRFRSAEKSVNRRFKVSLLLNFY